jgi:hypothetical protein
VEDLVP